MPSIYFTVTTDLSYDQRMIRICTSLANAGYSVTLAGRRKKDSIPLQDQPFLQKRLSCFFQKGKLFYLEYNLRLFFYLLFKKMDGVCAIDLDTILPCYYVSRLRNITRIYDAHELFCEMKEIVSRPRIYKFWKWIEQHTLPHFSNAYTVNQPIADAFSKMYGVDFKVIRSIALYREPTTEISREKFILYQGAVNEGRSFETLLPAMQWVNAPLVICGDGNFMQQAQAIVKNLNLQSKVTFRGMLPPAQLRTVTQKAYIGITLFEKDALSNYYSLANRFFDYIHAGVPQVCVDYPVYREINNLHNVAVLLNDISTENLAKHLNGLLADVTQWRQLHNNCLKAATILNWQEEEKKLIAFYKNIFG